MFFNNVVNNLLSFYQNYKNYDDKNSETPVESRCFKKSFQSRKFKTYEFKRTANKQKPTHKRKNKAAYF